MLQRTPRIYYVLSALGLPLYLWAFGWQGRVAALPAAFPARELLFPVRVEGITAASPEEVRFLAEGFPVGSAIEIVPAGGGTIRVSTARWISRTAQAATLASGLLFWAVSALVFAVRARSRSVRDFFWCSYLYGLAVMVGGVHFPGNPAWPAMLGALLQLACLAALPPIFVHLTLSFPRRHPLLARSPWAFRGIGLAAFLLVAWQWFAYLRYHARPTPERFHMMKVAGSAADLFMIVFVTLGFLILAAGMRRLELTRERAQVKWLLWGFAIGVTPYVFLRTLLQLLGISPPFGAAFDRLLEMAIPIAFVSAVVLYRFLDIDIIIRRSAVYVSLAVLMTVIIAGLGLLIGRRVPAPAGTPALLVPVAIGVVAGMVFLPLRRLIGTWIDRTFFKLTLGYGRATEALTERLRSLSGQRELLEVLEPFFVDLLKPKRAAVLVRAGDNVLCAGIADERARAMLEAVEHLGENAGALGTTARSNATSLPEIETVGFPEALESEGTVLVQRIRGGGKLAGAVLLGVRGTERRYIERDIHLIRNASAEAGRALERIRLVQRASEEEMARRRVEELERLKSDFLSRVAHDLRTPLASIVWSTENLLDGVTGEISESQAEYLRSVRASAGHLNRLVTNLLEISRLEQGGLDLSLELLDLRGALEEATSTARPLAGGKNVEIRLETPHALLLARANAGKLHEVLLNLLDNAVKFSAPGGIVNVEGGLEAAASRVFVRVRDAGPGLGDADPAELFERFRQGAPSPHGSRRGFGLGLYIVRSYVEMMGGDVAAANHPEGGAVFTCRFPVAAPDGSAPSAHPPAEHDSKREERG